MKRGHGFSILFPAILVFATIGCGVGGRIVEPEIKGALSLNPNSWSIMYSKDMPAHPIATAGGMWAMPLPGSSGHVNYVQTPYVPTTTPSQVSITFRIESSSDVVYDSVDPAARNPATFHLFLERRGDDLTKANYHWWSGVGGYNFGSQDNSLVTITVPLTPANWTNVNGQNDVTEFNNTLRELAWVGMTFGGQDTWGHGVNVREGTAKFVLIDYRIE